MHFVRYPPLFGDEGHTVSDDFVVSNTDLASVIFEITGVTKPDKYEMDGKSWVNDVLNDMNNMNNEPMTCCKYRYSDFQNSHLIASAEWSYIYRANTNDAIQNQNTDTFYVSIGDEEQLYNLKWDPNQQHNQINNASLSVVIATFQKLM